MDKFIQRILACANIDDQDSIIQTFPIISAYYHNVEKDYYYIVLLIMDFLIMQLLVYLKMVFN